MNTTSSLGLLKQMIEEGVEEVMDGDGTQAGLRSWKSLCTMLKA